MAQTKNDIVIPSGDWVSLNTASGISIGTAMQIQNKSTTWALLVESSTKPAANYTGGILITDLSHREPTKVISAGSLQIWAKSTVDGRSVVLSVQL